MTLIECFDRSPVDNIISCLRLRPEKLVFLGNEKEMEKSVKRYLRFLKDRNLNTEVILQDLQMEDMNEIIRVLADILKTESDYIIDITGGDDRIIVAVGMVLSSLDSDRRKHISVQSFDQKSATFTDCDGDGEVISGYDLNLTAQELIALHGGIVHPAKQQPGRQCSPSVLDPAWDILCQNPRDWNKTISALSEFESRTFMEPDIYVPLAPLQSVISGFEGKKARVCDLLYNLGKSHLIDDKSTNELFHYRYTNPLIKYCLDKEGNLLEVKCLLEARSMKENGKPYFHDCVMGVNIDWDGILHKPEEHVAETHNEIDLILMHGTTPLFVSCKNGTIEDVELYKLHTVASRFGGSSVKKMLIVTEIPQKNGNPNYAFIQRAKDMDIHLVKASQLSVSGWRDAFKKAIEL